ncbi:MAG: fumarate reductase/succinate dehydrogenase flavoprotein domain protein [Oscillospiraceae bacterium]|nr:fumarate reductase/succinate dehydrogenase flavoprotein domain protein [Oscillospiraceae bacterium]
MQVKKLSTDILIIGGGTAGIFAGITIAEESDANVLILEKAYIKRSGCLAAGVNALNAYICEGQKPEDYANYAMNDAHGIARYDLLLSMSQKLNSVTKKLEDLGLVILKDENGKYVLRGNRNIKINGENIKPILAKAVENHPKISVMNGVNAVEYAVKDGKAIGAYGVSVNNNIFYVIEAKAVICATGGAAGIYRPNNPGFSRHKMWYPPFNTGAGYAMGIRAGAEMTTFEMRFIALRCKDTIAPTGTIAQGVGARQINSLGEDYGIKYGFTTSQRVYGTVKENIEGRGPCYLETKGISQEQTADLYKAYLNMAPSQTLKWIESGKSPDVQNVEIEGTEPYIIGGHTASGYWVSDDRSTSIKGLYAAGDVAGGCPQKYVTGALAEGEIAAHSALSYIKGQTLTSISDEDIDIQFRKSTKYLNNTHSTYSINDLEEAMQTIMDTYAGGIKTNYQYNQIQLTVASEKINELIQLSEKLTAKNTRDLTKIFELKDRLEVARVLIKHLESRKETRWHSFAENTDYPQEDDRYLVYINSTTLNGETKMIFRPLIKEGQKHEHID